MKYFYDIHAQADQTNEIRFLLVPPVEKKAAKPGTPQPPQEEKISPLTAEMLKQNPAYAEFAKQKFPFVMVRYAVYKVESDLSGIENVDVHLKSLIESKKLAPATSGELQIVGKGGKKKAKKKLKLSKKLMNVIIAGITAVSLILGVGIGMYLGGLENVADDSGLVITDDDGLIMPNAIEFCPNAELLTISIDRSWSPVPREDLQVKSEIVDGVATITLPAFDRTDFFSHVPGYTWGFTSDPNGQRIEFYGGQIYEFTENIKLYRVLVRYGGGNGTKDDPYIINYFDQLQLMSQEKARGYFRQTEDIVFPCWAVHVPINTVNELRRAPDLENFEYDGGGFIISGLNAPLFGTVSGSVIKNVNVTGSFIESTRHGNFGFIVSEAFNYRYEIDDVTYETGETLIINSTVSHSTINLTYPVVENTVQTIPPTQPPAIVPPDLDLPEEVIISPTKRGEFAIGGISGIGGQIENCYVYNVIVVAELDDYFLYVGGISGKPANVINSGVVDFAVKGNVFHAGGIVGSAGGTRLYSADGTELPIFYGGNIQGCFVRNFVGYVETSAGGIAGEGSTNSENALISNSYAAWLDLRVGIFAPEDTDRINPLTLGISGGIIGTDGNENHGHLISNTVSLANYPVIGSMSISRFDETVRLAPFEAFNQAGILDVLNRNTVHPDAPAIIFTGSFMFADDDRNSDEGMAYAFPAEIAKLFERTVTQNE
jgi:hypothetical protein